MDDVRTALYQGVDGTSSLPQGVQVAGVKDDIAIELAGENQARTQEGSTGANNAQEAKEIEAGGPSPSVRGAVQAIGDAVVEAPYINPDGALLNAGNAVISPDKIVGYSLNPNNDTGKNKALVILRWVTITLTQIV